MPPRICINQLRRYAQVLIGALYAALDDVTSIEILPHLPDVRGLILVCEGGIASRNQKLGKLSQPRDQLLGNSIGKVLLIASGTHVVKGQNSNRGVLGERKSTCIAEKGGPKRSRLTQVERSPCDREKKKDAGGNAETLAADIRMRN